ncbi:helix-turn-helix domain-containing protein [Maricaulis salignorans]|uniref:helix-turn-helix domain-containing protein n=1 Tax=Maricaulis salignorans TaxID=144026 RepID=UPI003A8E0B78
MLTAEACRAGRALLGWGLEDLAEASGIAAGTLSRIENGRAMRAGTMKKLEDAFGSNGVEIVKTEDRTGAVLIYARRTAFAGGAKK